MDDSQCGKMQKCGVFMVEATFSCDEFYIIMEILHYLQWCDLSFTPVDGDGIDNDCDDLIDEEICSPENNGTGKNYTIMYYVVSYV